MSDGMAGSVRLRSVCGAEPGCFEHLVAGPDVTPDRMPDRLPAWQRMPSFGDEFDVINHQRSHMSTAKTRFIQQPIPARRIQPRSPSDPAQPTSATPALCKQARRNSRSFSMAQCPSATPAGDLPDAILERISRLEQCIDTEETPETISGDPTQPESASQIDHSSSKGQLSAKERMELAAKMQGHWKAQVPPNGVTQNAALKKKARNAPPEKRVETAPSEEKIQEAPAKAEVLQDQQESELRSPYERLLDAQKLSKALDAGSIYFAVTHTIRNNAKEKDQPALRRMLGDLDSSVTAFKAAVDKAETRSKRSPFKTRATSWFRSTPKVLERGIDEKIHYSLQYAASDVRHKAALLENELARLGLDTQAVSEVSGKIDAALSTVFPRLPDPI